MKSMTKRHKRSRIALSLTALLALSSCNTGAKPVPVATPQTFDGTVTSAVNTVTRFWDTEFPGPSGFKHPAIYSYSAVGDPYCDGKPSDLDNALYCPDSSFVSFDVNFMKNGYQKYGAMFVYFIFAHEFGHAAQNKVGQSTHSVKEKEQQADCLAGSYFAFSQQQGWIVLTPDDMVQLQASVVSLGDDSIGSTTTGDNGHGTGAERYASMSKGYTGSVHACKLNGF